MSQIYRNHPAALIKNIAVLGFIGVVLYFSSGSYFMLLLPLFFGLYSVAAWYMTHLTVYEDYAVAETNLLSKRTTTIPFGKVASVNEVKGIFGRIFGWTTVQININSSQNFARPDVSFTFGDAVAEKIVPLMKYGSGIGVQETVIETEEAVTEPEPDEPVFKFSFMDAVVFGIMGSSTYSLLSAVFWGGFSVVTFVHSSAISLPSVFLFIFMGILPMVQSILKHGDFRVYRNGATVRMIHGLTTLYDTSFEMTRVNAVCVKRAFIPRMFGRCCLQAEVVGINADAKSTTPNVTLLIPEERLPYAMQSLFPEFIYPYELKKQPAEAKFPTFSRRVYISLFSLIALLAVYLTVDFDTSFDYVYIFIAAGVAIPAVLFLHGIFSLRIRKVGYGDEMMTVISGVLDTSEYTMQYSKIQTMNARSTPMSRRFGLARMHISLLTSGGGTNVSTGFFPEEEADAVGERIVELSGKKLDVVMKVAEPAVVPSES